MKIFLICPVRWITETERVQIAEYVAALEAEGRQVHWPVRDTDQSDPVGLRICETNRAKIEEAGAVHVWYNDASQGSIFDFGMVFALRKKLVIANSWAVVRTPHKSFGNVLLAYSEQNSPE